MQQENSYVEPTVMPQDVPTPPPVTGGTVNQTPVNSNMPPMTSEPKKGSSKVIIILVVVILVLVLISIGGFLVYRNIVESQKNTQTPLPTNILTPTPYVIPTIEPSPAASSSASPVASESQSGEGNIIGTICYPSEVIPAGKVLAKDTTKNTTISFDNPANNSSFSISLPVGQYKLKYQPTSGSAGYYTTCTGTEAVCQDNTTKRSSIITTVIAGQASSGVKICDYYYQVGMEPDF